MKTEPNPRARRRERTDDCTESRKDKTDLDVLHVHLAEELISPQRTEPHNPRHLLTARHFKHPSSQHRFEAPCVEGARGVVWFDLVRRQACLESSGYTHAGMTGEGAEDIPLKFFKRRACRARAGRSDQRRLPACRVGAPRARDLPSKSFTFYLLARYGFARDCPFSSKRSSSVTGSLNSTTQSSTADLPACRVFRSGVAWRSTNPVSAAVCFPYPDRSAPPYYIP